MTERNQQPDDDDIDQLLEEGLRQIGDEAAVVDGRTVPPPPESGYGKAALAAKTMAPPPGYVGSKTMAPPKLGSEITVMEMLRLSGLAAKYPVKTGTSEQETKSFILGEGTFSEEALTQALLAAEPEIFSAFLELDEISIKFNNGSVKAEDSGADSDDGRKKRKSKLSPMEVIDALGNKGLLEKAISINPQKAFELKAPLLAQMGLTKLDGGALKRYKVYLEHKKIIGALGLVESVAVGPEHSASKLTPGKIWASYTRLANFVGVPKSITSKILTEGDEKVKRLQAAIEGKAKTLSLEQLSELVKHEPWKIITGVRRGLERVLLDSHIIDQSLFDRLKPGELTGLEARMFPIEELGYFLKTKALCEADPALMEPIITLMEEQYGTVQYYKARLEQLRQILQSLFSGLQEIDEKHSL